MRILIEKEILEKYPQVEIGYLIAKVTVNKHDPFVDTLKKSLWEHLQKEKMHATNFVLHPQLAIWRKIYEEDFQVKAKTYRSSIEALVKRLLTAKEIWNISNVVDVYNCCSVLSLLPMGGYDLSKISGDIKIRYAKEGESFRGLGSSEKVEAKAHHVVYADDQRILCWLWNHKDAAETCVDEKTQSVIFFIDSMEPHKVKDASQQLAHFLEKIQGIPLETGVLNYSCSDVMINLVNIFSLSSKTT